MTPERQDRFTEDEEALVILGGPNRGKVVGAPDGAKPNAMQQAMLDATDEHGNVKPGAKWPPDPVTAS